MITVQEAALRKGVRATAIYNAIERGALVTSEVFGRKVLRAADVEAYQPGSYGGVKRAKLPRGPGRRPKPDQTKPDQTKPDQKGENDGR